jgi:ADP-heptose:LPS heptosyltransferase
MIGQPRLQHQPIRIAAFRALHLGDLLLAVPALRALRAGFPHAEITLIGLPWAASFVRRFHHYVDRFVEFAGFPGIAEVEVIPERTAWFIAQQRAYHYDVVIQMHGSGQTSNRLALALGGRMTVGYFEGSDKGDLTLGEPYPDTQPEVYRNLGLAQMLGCPAANPDLEFPLYSGDYAGANMLLSRCQRAPRPYIGLHVGAHAPARRWPVAYFARVADELAHLCNAQVILTGGIDEQTTVQFLEEQMTTRPINLAGKTSLGALAAIIESMDLFISNDTGPAHLADALGTPSITIFGPADYQRWAPLNQHLHRVVRSPVACSPDCGWACATDHHCLEWVKPAMVIEAACDLLAKGAVA